MNTGFTSGLLVLLLILTGTLSTGLSPSAANPLDPGEIPIESKIEVSAEDYSGMNKFASLLWTKTATNGNSVVSPLSAYYALAMCANGAAGKTISDFSALGLSEDFTVEKLNAILGSLAKRLTAIDDGGEKSTKVTIANSVWVDDDYNVRKEYVQALAGYFRAEAFSADLPTSVGKVNSWIESKTNGMIKDMLKDIDPSVLMLLVNTIYMDAKWQSPFDAENTHKDVFTTLKGDKQQTDFMFSSKYADFIENADMEGIVLPYRGGLDFIALLPKDTGASTGDFIEKLNGSYTLEGLAASATNVKVNLTMPKFEVTSDIPLKDVLISLGMGGIFSDSADFSLIGEGITVGDVLQKARLRLDEDGTEAAAATVIMMKTTAMIEETKPRVLEFDRPFVYAVVDRDTGAVLFCGEYNSAK